MSGKRKEIKSEFNPDGLMVAPILTKIRRAFEYDTNIPIDVTEGLHHAMTRPTLTESKVDEYKWGEFPIITMPRPMTIRYRNLLEADEMVVKEGDAKRAWQVCRHPMLLLFSPEHADAVARWEYGRYYGVRPATRKQASKLLDAARPVKEGAPAHFRGDFTSLRETYDDLVIYGDALRACIRKTNLPEIVEHHFPDCHVLVEVGCTDPRQLAGGPARDVPTGRQIAETVFDKVVGWKRTQIKKMLFPKPD